MGRYTIRRKRKSLSRNRFIIKINIKRNYNQIHFQIFLLYIISSLMNMRCSCRRSIEGWTTMRIFIIKAHLVGNSTIYSRNSLLVEVQISKMSMIPNKLEAIIIHNLTSLELPIILKGTCEIYIFLIKSIIVNLFIYFMWIWSEYYI